MKTQPYKSITTFLAILKVTPKIMPQSKWFVFFFFFFKFIGILSWTNSLEEEIVSKISTYKIANYFTYYNCFSRNSPNLIKHEIQLILLYIIILIPFMFFLLWNYLLKSRCNEDSKRILIRFNGITKVVFMLFIWIAFFSQHIIEILSFNFTLLLKSTIKDNHWNSIQDKLDKASEEWNLNNYILITFNSVFILLTNWYVFIFFKSNNSPFTSQKINFKFNYSDYFLFLHILLFNAQSITYYPNIWSKAFQTIISCVFMFLLLVLVSLHSKDYLSKDFYNKTIFIFIFFSFYSGFTSLLNYYFDLYNETLYFIWKYFLIMIFVYSSMTFMYMFHDAYNKKETIEKLFSTNYDQSPKYLFYLNELLVDTVQDWNNIIYLFNIIEEHKWKCIQWKDCEVKRIDIEDLLTNWKINASNNSQQSQASKVQLINQKCKLIILMIENEINNYIAWNAQMKTNRKSSWKAIVVQWDFTFYLKRNIPLTWYWIQQYLGKINDMPYEYMIYLNNLKTRIHETVEDNCKKARQCDKERWQANVAFFYNYKLIEEIKNSMIKWVDNYNVITNLKWLFSELNSKDRKNVMHMNTTQNLQKIFDTSMDIEISLNNFNEFLYRNFLGNKLNNPEISYLLTLFYTIINKKIPQKLKLLFLEIYNYEYVLNYPSAFAAINFEHPVIINLGNTSTQSNNNTIKYISQKLVDILGYTNNDLLDADVNTLLPQWFTHQHNIAMKKSLFIKQKESLNKSIFLIDKHHYYIKANIITHFFPDFISQLLVICNITIQNVNKTWYTFLWDKHTNIIAMSSQFADNYRLSYEIISRFDITFCQFFGWNYERWKKEFNETVERIEKINNSEMIKIGEWFTRSKWHEKMSMHSKGGFKFQSHCYQTVVTNAKLKTSIEKLKNKKLNNDSSNEWEETIQVLYTNILKTNTEFEFNFQISKLGDIPFYVVKVRDKESFANKVIHDSLINENKVSKKQKTERDPLLQSPEQGPSNLTQLNNQIITSNNTDFYKSSWNLNDSKQVILDDVNNKAMQKGFGIKKSIFGNQNGVSSITTLSSLHLREAMVYYISIFLMVLILFLFLYNFILKSTEINIVKDALNINVISLRLKEFVLETANGVIEAYTIVGNITDELFQETELTTSFIKSLSSIRSQNLFDEYNSWTNFISKYWQYTTIVDLNEWLYQVHTYTLLNSDYTTYEYTSDFDSEIHFYHFNIGYLKHQDMLSNFNLTEFFIENNKPIWEATEDDKLFYYITKNLPNSFMDTLEQLLLLSNKFVMNEYNNSKIKVNIYNIVLLIVGIMLILSQLTLLVVNKHIIQIHFDSFFYKSNINIRAFSLKLGNLRNILSSMDLKICLNYDSVVNDINNNIKITSRKQIATPKKNKSKDNKNWKRQPNQQGKISKLIKEDIEAEQHPITRITVNIYLLNIFKASFAWLTISLLLHIVLLSVNIWYSQDLYTTIRYMINMSNAFWDRIPSYNEIILYYGISIINKNSKYISRHPDDYYNFVSYFQNENEKDLEKMVNDNIANNQQYIILQESKMAFLYYRVYYEDQLGTSFDKTNKKTLWKERNAFASGLQRAGACNHIASYYAKYLSHPDDGLSEELINKYCLSLEGGANDKQTTAVAWNFFSYLLDDYVDFVKTENGINTKQILDFLNSEIFVSLSRQMIFIINIIWTITALCISNDLENLFASIISTETVFELWGITLWILIIIAFCMGILFKMKQQLKDFGKAITRINNTLE